MALKDFDYSCSFGHKRPIDEMNVTRGLKRHDLILTLLCFQEQTSVQKLFALIMEVIDTL